MFMMCIFLSLCISVLSGYIALSDTFFPSRRTEGLHVEFERNSLFPSVCWGILSSPSSSSSPSEYASRRQTLRDVVRLLRSKLHKDKHLDSCEVKTINEGLIIAHSQDAWKCIFENQRKSPWGHDLTSPPRAHINQLNSWSHGLATLCLVVTFQ